MKKRDYVWNCDLLFKNFMIRNRRLTLVNVQKVNDLMTHGERLKIKKRKKLRIAFWFGSRLKNKRDFQGVSGAEPLEEF